ncbi:hypothetical protein Vretimale_11266 [Volvox reticuliferus]|uniref:phosphatidylinositol-3,4,5-trisphosphate 3-phosphatase n=1 Tax=Volvox reticuliferus TaxID=1737510 RepID=A0A8J4LRG7_9CHLO|nr:hypothetical protein Vretimale_11266 [Volvox reticuliferus]
MLWLVSTNKRRYQQDGYDLDMSYITPRIIAMGFPCDGVSSFYRNPVDNVVRLLEARHTGVYKVYNLCVERGYDPRVFKGRVMRVPMYDGQAPPLHLILEVCRDAVAWLAADSAHVVAVHCKAGKGRTGAVVCALLLAMNPELGPASLDQTLALWAKRRTRDGKGLSIPSQRRFVGYFYQLLLEAQRKCYDQLRPVCDRSVDKPAATGPTGAQSSNARGGCGEGGGADAGEFRAVGCGQPGKGNNKDFTGRCTLARGDETSGFTTVGGRCSQEQVTGDADFDKRTRMDSKSSSGFQTGSGNPQHEPISKSSQSQGQTPGAQTLHQQQQQQHEVTMQQRFQQQPSPQPQPQPQSKLEGLVPQFSAEALAAADVPHRPVKLLRLRFLGLPHWLLQDCTASVWWRPVGHHEAHPVCHVRVRHEGSCAGCYNPDGAMHSAGDRAGCDAGGVMWSVRSQPNGDSSSCGAGDGGCGNSSGKGRIPPSERELVLDLTGLPSLPSPPPPSALPYYVSFVRSEPLKPPDVRADSTAAAVSTTASATAAGTSNRNLQGLGHVGKGTQQLSVVARCGKSANVQTHPFPGQGGPVISGDVKIQIFRGSIMDPQHDVFKGSVTQFSAWICTSFLDPRAASLELSRRELDKLSKRLRRWRGSLGIVLDYEALL